MSPTSDSSGQPRNRVLKVAGSHFLRGSQWACGLGYRIGELRSEGRE